MERKKLDKLWNEIKTARRAPQSAGDLEELAKMAERLPRTGGKHVMWLSPFPQHRPFPIPRHGKEPVPMHVRKVVLDALEADAAQWEEELDKADDIKSTGMGEE